MKTILISMTALAAIAGAALPAAAQDYRGGHHDYGRQDYGRQDYGRQDYGRQDYGRQTVTGNVDSYDWQINTAAQQGRISWREARQLRSELQQVKPIAWRVQTGEASGWERERLQRTMGHIQSALNGYGRSAYRGYRR